MLNFIVTENSITILINNRPEIIDNTHENFEKVEAGLKSGMNETQILELMNVGKAVEKFAAPTNGKVQVKDGEITYNGKPVHSALSRRIMSLMENGFDITPFTNFMENLYQNPSKSAVDDLYGFLEACTLPITPDGYFLAYKKIKADYTDVYTGTIDNSIGARPSMPRYEVNEDSNQTCSTGLHVASFSYMSSYSGDRTVICKIHPKDVVAVPNDYNNAKMRVCEYEVVNEVENLKEEITDNVISNDEVYSEEHEDYDEHPDDTYDESFEHYSDDEAPCEVDERGVVNGSCDSEMLNVNSEFTEADHEPMSDEDYDNSPLYEDCESMLADVALYDLNDCRINFNYIPEAKVYLNSITSSTSFWKKALINILHAYYGFEDCPEDMNTPDNEFYSKPRTEKMKFTKALEEYLRDFNEDNWKKIMTFLDNKNLSSAKGIITTSYQLNDYRTVITKLKSLTKDGKFKKKELLKSLGI